MSRKIRKKKKSKYDKLKKQIARMKQDQHAETQKFDQELDKLRL